MIIGSGDTVFRGSVVPRGDVWIMQMTFHLQSHSLTVRKDWHRDSHEAREMPHSFLFSVRCLKRNQMSSIGQRCM